MADAKVDVVFEWVMLQVARARLACLAVACLILAPPLAACTDERAGPGPAAEGTPAASPPAAIAQPPAAKPAKLAEPEMCVPDPAIPCGEWCNEHGIAEAECAQCKQASGPAPPRSR